MARRSVVPRAPLHDPVGGACYGRAMSKPSIEFGERVHIAQQRCGQLATGTPCIAWRLSRPGGEDWKPCWLCGTEAPPLGQRYSR